MGKEKSEPLRRQPSRRGGGEGDALREARLLKKGEEGRPGGEKASGEGRAAPEERAQAPRKVAARPPRHARDNHPPPQARPQLTTASSFRLWLNAATSSAEQSLFPPLESGRREHDTGPALRLTGRGKEKEPLARPGGVEGGCCSCRFCYRHFFFPSGLLTWRPGATTATFWGGGGDSGVEGSQ